MRPSSKLMIHIPMARYYGPSMVDVFVSHVREDAERVQPLVELLQASGRSVWWGRDITEAWLFEHELERAVATAGCVMIALTKHAANFDWLRAEATLARHQTKLIPVLLDDVPIPPQLRTLQISDLREWPVGWRRRIYYQRYPDARLRARDCLSVAAMRWVCWTKRS